MSTVTLKIKIERAQHGPAPLENKKNVANALASLASDVRSVPSALEGGV